MQLPFFFPSHPREQEAPAWAKVLSEGMGLALENQDIIMSQIEDVRDSASRLHSKIDRLRDAIQEMQSRPQPVQEPDMSEVLSELNAADADVDSLLASVTATSQPAATTTEEEPASTASPPPSTFPITPTDGAAPTSQPAV